MPQSHLSVHKPNRITTILKKKGRAVVVPAVRGTLYLRLTFPYFLSVSRPDGRAHNFYPQPKTPPDYYF